MTYLPPKSTLHRLKHEDIFWIVLQDGRKAEALWSANNKGFYYRESEEEKFVGHAEVYEWWPASVKL